MSPPPTVLLPARPAVKLPRDAIEIPPPSPAPLRPAGNLLYQVAPAVLTASGMGIILVFSNLQSGASNTLGIILLGTLLLVGGGAGVSVLMYRSQTRSFREDSRQRVARYYAMLAETRDRLIGLLEEQRRMLLDKDPEPL